jgi:hypothetical protein
VETGGLVCAIHVYRDIPGIDYVAAIMPQVHLLGVIPDDCIQGRYLVGGGLRKDKDPDD